MASKREALILVILLTGWLLPQAAGAQSHESAFTTYLMQSGRYRMALQWMDETDNLTGRTASDSAAYFRGMAHYYLKELPAAIDSWEKVPPESRLASPAGLYRGWTEAYLGRYDRADSIYSTMSGSTPEEVALIDLQKLGMVLLNKNSAAYPRIRTRFSEAPSMIGESLIRMDGHFDNLAAFRPKSMALAGIGSALVPGLGKVYAGETGSGISSFLLVGALGAMAIENGIRSGWTHWNTLLFGGLFLVFHAGNVYGSMMSIKEYRKRFYEQSNQHILWDMHMPVRDYYR